MNCGNCEGGLDQFLPGIFHGDHQSLLARTLLENLRQEDDSSFLRNAVPIAGLAGTIRILCFIGEPSFFSDEKPGNPRHSAVRVIFVKASARYFVRYRGTTTRGLRDSVDACQLARSSMSLSASLRDESPEEADSVALDGRVHSGE